ncbi:hypothetical protein HDU83_004313 [Entophlyctis luteolus]|nr:hypothetical protein HDU83_004313 [Entophlyctis luteolus]
MPIDLQALKGIVRPPFDAAADSAPGTYFPASADGHLIYSRFWKPAGTAKARIIAIHGLGEHISRYDHVFSAFAANGFLVKGLDYRGHGRTVFKNKGIQGYTYSFEQVYQDLLQLAALPVDGLNENGLPTFIFGHSMGGLIALGFVVAHGSSIPNLRGVISQAPAIGPGKPVPGLLQTGVKLVGNLIPKVQQNNNLDLEGLSSSQAAVEDYLRDPLNHPYITVQLARDMFVTSDRLIAAAADFQLPLIMYHNELDIFTSPVISSEWFKKAGSSDKTYKLFTKADLLGHEIHGEPSVKEGIISDYVAWMNARV